MKKYQLAFYGAIGAISPDVLILYSKRWTMPSVTFEPSQYAMVMAVYLVLASVVSAIYPYGGKPTQWKAFSLGAGLPLTIAGLSSVARDEVISPRGETIPGTILDLMSLL